MATPFSKIYDIFLSNIDSYSLFKLLEEDEEAFLEECKTWLIQAITNNPLIFEVTLDFSNDNNEFVHDLTLVEIVSLGKLMVVEYLNPFVLSEVSWRQTLNSKDYRSYKPSGHIKDLQSVKRNLEEEVRTMINRQSYSIENIKKAFGKKK